MVWALEKLPYYFDGTKFTMYTNHQAILACFNNRLRKKSIRLDNWFLFLAKYAHKMNIVHRAGKTYLNVDAFSWLHSDGGEPVPACSNLLYKSSQEDISVFSISCLLVTQDD